MDSETSLALGSVIFAIVAGYFFALGFSVETTIIYDGQPVANAQLMHTQATYVLIGVGSAVVSAILATGAAIVAVIRRASSQAG